MSQNKATEPKIWSQTHRPWLPGIFPLTLIGLWLDPSYKQLKRDNVEAYFVFLWTASCVALSHVFLASCSPCSWQVPIFNFYLPTLQWSCLCVGLCVGRLKQDSGCAGACRGDLFFLFSILLFLFTSHLWSELPMWAEVCFGAAAFHECWRSIILWREWNKAQLRLKSACF